MCDELPVKFYPPDSFLEEEERMGYRIDSEKKRLWAVQIDLLRELDRVCLENGIKYSLACGSMIGVVRHKGFIPWDDDIDVVMSRGDYEKLCDIAHLFETPYFFQTEYSDPGCLRGHAQLRNSLTTAILESEYQYSYEFNQGVFIDIFPYDHIPDNLDERMKFINRLRICKRIMERIRLIEYDRYSESNIKCIIKRVIYPLLAFVCRMIKIERSIYGCYERIMKQYNKTTTKEVGICCFLPSTTRFIWSSKQKKESFLRRKFEYIEVMVSSDYESILDDIYGDWKTPKQAKNMHGKLIFSTAIPYYEYFK